jgi:hypothetical protein
MNEVNYFSIRMAKLTNAELKNYLENKEDFQDYAVLAALLELEKRGIVVENSDEIKKELNEIKESKAVEIEPTIEEAIQNDASAIATDVALPALYSTQSIFIFGALFSVFGGGILMALNLFQLNKKNSGWLVIMGAILYSYLLSYIYTALNIADKVTITNLISVQDIFIALLISVVSSLFGVFLLYKLVWEKEKPSSSNYEKKGILKPVFIILAINLVIGLILLSSGNMPQL